MEPIEVGDEGGQVTCGICGKTATFDEEVEDTWHPYAYLGEKEVSPVCPDHPGHWDDLSQQIGQVDLPESAGENAEHFHGR